MVFKWSISGAKRIQEEGSYAERATFNMLNPHHMITVEEAGDFRESATSTMSSQKTGAPSTARPPPPPPATDQGTGDVSSREAKRRKLSPGGFYRVPLQNTSLPPDSELDIGVVKLVKEDDFGVYMDKALELGDNISASQAPTNEHIFKFDPVKVSQNHSEIPSSVADFLLELFENLRKEFHTIIGGAGIEKGMKDFLKLLANFRTSKISTVLKGVLNFKYDGKVACLSDLPYATFRRHLGRLQILTGAPVYTDFNGFDMAKIMLYKILVAQGRGLPSVGVEPFPAQLGGWLSRLGAFIMSLNEVETGTRQNAPLGATGGGPGTISVKARQPFCHVYPTKRDFFMNRGILDTLPESDSRGMELDEKIEEEGSSCLVKSDWIGSKLCLQTLARSSSGRLCWLDATASPGPCELASTMREMFWNFICGDLSQAEADLLWRKKNDFMYGSTFYLGKGDAYEACTMNFGGVCSSLPKDEFVRKSEWPSDFEIDSRRIMSTEDDRRFQASNLDRGLDFPLGRIPDAKPCSIIRYTWLAKIKSVPSEENCRMRGKHFFRLPLFDCFHYRFKIGEKY